MSLKDQKATLTTLTRIFDNIIQYPNDDKYRQIKLSSKTFTSKVWQYPAGEELMKMSGWVVEGDHVRLKDDSCVEIVSQLLKSTTGVVPFPDDELEVLIKAFYNGDIACIQKLLKPSRISPSGIIYSESGSSLNLLEIATIAQRIDTVKLLLTNFSVDPYEMSMSDDTSLPYIVYIFYYAPQSFIIELMKYYGVKTNFRTAKDNSSLLHIAVMFNCFDVVSFLLEHDSVSVNATDADYLQTPLHLAYLYGHTQIAEYLMQHGANVYAVDSTGHTPYEYIDGDPDAIKNSKYFQNRRKIHHIPFRIEHCYYIKLTNLGIDDKEAVSLTMKEYPSLTSTPPHYDINQASGSTLLHHDISQASGSTLLHHDIGQASGSTLLHHDIGQASGSTLLHHDISQASGSTLPHHDTHHTSGLKEFTQYITARSDGSRKLEKGVTTSTWTKSLSPFKREFLFTSI